MTSGTIWDTSGVSNIIFSCKIVEIFYNGTCVPYWTVAFRGEVK